VSDLRISQPLQKLAHCFLGPYEIVKAVGPHAYKLKLPCTLNCIHPVFNVVKLKAAPEDPIAGRHVQPPPELEMVDGQEEYEVEVVKDSCLRYGGKLEFLIAWKGYGREVWTWECEEDVYAPGLVSAFYQANPEAPRRILPQPQEHMRTCAPRRGSNVRGHPVNALLNIHKCEAFTQSPH
jgi:hypothetical protein